MRDAKDPEVQPVGRPKASYKLVSIKVRDDAYKAISIASGYTGDSLIDFCSDILIAASKPIIAREHKLWEKQVQEETPKEGKK